MAGCRDGKPGSSRRACSPAGTRQDKSNLHSSSNVVFLHTDGFLPYDEDICKYAAGFACIYEHLKVLRGADLNLLLKQVDLVLLLDKLLLLLSNLRHKTEYSHTHIACI